jgi:hypothetical protein
MLLDWAQIKWKNQQDMKAAREKIKIQPQKIRVYAV